MPLHHYLPASFIARFSTDNRTKVPRDKLIIVGDKKTQKLFSSPANKVGCIHNLYTLVDHSRPPDLVDQTWKEYEQKLPVAIEGLINRSIDAETWTRVLIPFVACMLVRGPDFEERFNQRFPPEVQQMMNDYLTLDNANLARLRDLQRLLACVVAAKWLVLTTHGKERLITNDLGFAPFINPKFGHRGLAIPLSQRRVLAIIPSMDERAILYEKDGNWIPKIEYADLPSGNHQGLNKVLAQTALRFIFGPDAQTVQKYFHEVPQVSKAPEPTELGFPVELLSPAYEFTWHRLVGAIKKRPSDKEGWTSPLDWEVIASGWHSMPFTPINLVEFPPALQRVDNTIQLKFYDSEIYYDISSIPLLEQEGNHNAVIEIVTKALSHNLSPSLRASILASRGGILADSGKIDEAIADFEEACKLDSSNAKAHVDYGYTLLKADKAKEAVRALSKAIKLDPKLGAAYLNRSAAFWTLGHLTESVEDSTTAIELLSDEVERAGAFLNRGLVFQDLNLYQKAADDFALAASLYTDTSTKAKCFTRQAYALASLGLLNQALEAYNNSIELNHVDYEALAGRALLYLKLGEDTQALKDRDLAILHAPDLESRAKIMRIKGFRLVKQPSYIFYLLILISILVVAYVLIISLDR